MFRDALAWIYVKVIKELHPNEIGKRSHPPYSATCAPAVDRYALAHTRSESHCGWVHVHVTRVHPETQGRWIGGVKFSKKPLNVL